ncbi:UNVERIFIED_ORG: hypothetical protein J2X79_004234 [Arthrobacter globiformis]|nr:hypothetical protein [Arthrobacter globiformis]
MTVLLSGGKIEMKSFTLTGDGIETRYNADDGVLSVQGEHLPGTDRRFSGGNLEISTSELGTMLTGVLLESTRNSAQIRLSVLVPAGLRKLHEARVTGALIIVTDRTKAMDSGPDPLHDFEVRQLSGTMQD